MRRFLAEVLLYSAAGALLWWVTMGLDLTRPLTIEGVKILHRFCGYPAPHLLAEIKPFFWYSPLFLPLVGLFCASRWLSWPRRLGLLAIALICFWLIVALQMVLVYSPYLPVSAFRSYMERMGISAGYLGAQIVLWVLLTGGPYRLSAARDDAEKEAHPLWGNWWLGPVSAAMFSLAFAIPIFVAATYGTPDWRTARQEMAEGLNRNDDARALIGAQRVIASEPRNDPLIYLAARLHLRRGENVIAAQMLRIVFTRRGFSDADLRRFETRNAISPGSSETRD